MRLFILTSLACVFLAVQGCGDSEIQSLVAQLEGEHCRYSGNAHEVCAKRSRAKSWLELTFSRGGGRARCVTGAARCLVEKGPEAVDAVPALIRALLDGPNDFDTGDGVIPARSTIAAALAAIGDPRAIPALATTLENAEPADRGAGASITDEPAAREAIIDALATFGSAAGEHWPSVAAVLDERNATANAFIDAQYAQFDRECATDVVIDSIRAASGESSFIVPLDAVASALENLDRTGADYLRKREERATDRLASTAANALGAFGRGEAIPVLTRALENPAAAAAAAVALSRLGAHSPHVLVALRTLWSSNTGGPAARGAAARALGAVGDIASARSLAEGLTDPGTCEPCAAALADFAAAGVFGNSSAGASDVIAALQEVLGQPSLVERESGRVTYSAEASRQLVCKRKCMQVLVAIGNAQALVALEAFVNDPDLGREVRRAIGR